MTVAEPTEAPQPVPYDAGAASPTDRLDIVVLLALVTVAALLRFWDLGGLPYGLHGDEAATGLDARRILNEGYIGPYTASALGQPAGPMYVAAVFLELFGAGVATVRLPMALFGALTVALGFLFLRAIFDRPAAYFGAFLLTCSAWLIFYNRTGFTVSAFPLSEVAAILAVWTATQRMGWTWSVLAGAVVGLGIYGYFAYPLFAVGLAIWLLVDLAMRWPEPLKPAVAKLAIMGLTALIVILPMAPYLTAGDEEQGYSHDRKIFALVETAKYKAAVGLAGRLEVVGDNAVTTFKRLLWEKRPDGSDGSGEWPALDPVTIAFAAAGLVMSAYYLVRKRDARYALAPILIVCVAAGPILSIDGTNRRSLGLLVPTVMLASVAASTLWQALRRLRPGPALFAGITAFVIIVAFGAGINLRRYYADTPGTPNARFSFAPELTEAGLLMDRQLAGSRVYFASDRWSIHYETVRFLAPDILGEDRASAFAGGRNDWLVDRDQAALIVLIGSHQQAARQIAAMYPDAARLTGPQVNSRPAYVAFVVPALD